MEEDKELEFNELLEELADEELLDVIQSDERFPEVTDDNVNEFVLEYGSKLVKDGMDAINRVKPKITSGQDADEISALSELMRAMNSTLGTLTKISLQNKKEVSDRKQTELTYDKKKELGHSPRTQVLIGTREDVIKDMMKAVQGEVIDVTPEQIETNDEE